jgi:hypothetical protein
MLPPIALYPLATNYLVGSSLGRSESFRVVIGDRVVEGVEIGIQRVERIVIGESR